MYGGLATDLDSAPETVPASVVSAAVNIQQRPSAERIVLEPHNKPAKQPPPFPSPPVIAVAVRHRWPPDSLLRQHPEALRRPLPFVAVGNTVPMQLQSLLDQVELPVVHVEAAATDILVAGTADPLLREQTHDSTRDDLAQASARILFSCRISITCNRTKMSMTHLADTALGTSCPDTLVAPFAVASFAHTVFAP